jgi:hypothetical protein
VYGVGWWVMNRLALLLYYSSNPIVFLLEVLLVMEK